MQNRNSTVVQRRFDQKSLLKVETVDMVFGPEISRKQIDYSIFRTLQKDIKRHEYLLTELNSQLVGVPASDKKQFRSLKNKIKRIEARLKKLLEKNKSMDHVAVNFRLAGTALLDSEHIASAFYLPTEIIADTQKEKILRVFTGKMKNFALKEMIIFFQDQPKDVIKTRPLKRIDFMGLKKPSTPKPSWMSTLRSFWKFSWMGSFKPYSVPTHVGYLYTGWKSSDLPWDYP